jgi:hypothetical protein
MLSKRTLNSLLAGSTEGSQFLLSCVRVVERQMANEVAFVTEGFATFRTFVALFSRRRWNIVRIVIKVLMSP